MPTVLRFGAYRVVIYPNDHRPAHVHVIGNSCEAVFELNCAEGSAGLRENYGFGRAELRRIAAVLATHTPGVVPALGGDSWACLNWNARTRPGGNCRPEYRER